MKTPEDARSSSSPSPASGSPSPGSGSPSPASGSPSPASDSGELLEKLPGDYVWIIMHDYDEPILGQISIDDDTNTHFRKTDKGDYMLFVVDRKMRTPARWFHTKYLIPNNSENHYTVAKETKRKLKEEEANEAEKSSQSSTNFTEHEPQNVGGNSTKEQVNGGNAVSKEEKSNTLVAKESLKAKNSHSSAASASSQSTESDVASKKETRTRCSRAKKQNIAKPPEKESVAAHQSISAAGLDTCATNLNDLPLSEVDTETCVETLRVTKKKPRETILDHSFTAAELLQAFQYMESIYSGKSRKITDAWNTMQVRTDLSKRSLIRYWTALERLVNNFEIFRTETQFSLSLARFTILTNYCLDRVNRVPLPDIIPTKEAKNQKRKLTTDKKNSSLKRVKMAENQEASGDYLDEAWHGSGCTTNGNGSSEATNDSDPPTSSASGSPVVQLVAVNSQEMDIDADATPVNINGFAEHSATKTPMDASVNLNGSLHQDEDVNENRRKNSQEDVVKVSGCRIRRATIKKREMENGSFSPEAVHLHNGWSDDKSQINGDDDKFQVNGDDDKFEVNGDDGDEEKPASKQSKLETPVVKESSEVESSYPAQSDSVPSSSQSIVKEVGTGSAGRVRRMVTAGRKLKKNTVSKRTLLSGVKKDSIKFRILEGKMTYLDVKTGLLEYAKFGNVSELALKYDVETHILCKQFCRVLSKGYLSKDAKEPMSDLVKFQPIKDQLYKILQHYSYCGWYLDNKEALQLANELLKKESSESVCITESELMDFCLVNNILKDSSMFLERKNVLQHFVSTIQDVLERINVANPNLQILTDPRAVVISHQFEVPPPINFSHRIFVECAVTCNGFVFNPLVQFIGPDPIKFGHKHNVRCVFAPSLREAENKKPEYFKKMLNYQKHPKLVVYDGQISPQLEVSRYLNLDPKSDFIIRAPTYDPVSGISQDFLRLLPRLLQRFFYSKMQHLTVKDQIISRIANIAANLRTEFFCRETIKEVYKEQGLHPPNYEKAIAFDMEANEKDLAERYKLPQLPAGWKGGLRLSEEKKRELVGFSATNNLEEPTLTSTTTDPHTTTLKNTSSSSSNATTSTDAQTRGSSESNEQPTNFLNSSGNLNEEREMLPSTSGTTAPSNSRTMMTNPNKAKAPREELVETKRQNALANGQVHETNTSKGNVPTRQRNELEKGELPDQGRSKGIVRNRKRIFRSKPYRANCRLKPYKVSTTKRNNTIKSKPFTPTKPMFHSLALALAGLDMDKMREQLQDTPTPAIDDSINTEKALIPVKRPACIRCHNVSMDSHDFADHWRFCSKGDVKMTALISVDRLMEIKSEATEYDLSAPSIGISKAVEKFVGDLDKGAKYCSKNEKYFMPCRDIFYSTGFLSHIFGIPLGDQLNKIIQDKKILCKEQKTTGFLLEKKHYEEDFTDAIMDEIHRIHKRVKIVTIDTPEYLKTKNLKLPFVVKELLPAVKDVDDTKSDQESATEVATVDVASRKKPAPAVKSKQRPKSSADLIVESEEEKALDETKIDSCSSSDDDDTDFVKLPMNFNAVHGWTQQIVVSGTNRVNLCWVCKTSDKHIRACSGACSHYFHPECLKGKGLKKLDSSFKCEDCKNNMIKCIHCNKATADDGSNEFSVCSKTGCKRNYHHRCKQLKAESILEVARKQGHPDNSKTRNHISGPPSGCLAHICYTCYGSEDSVARMTASKTWAPNAKRILRCVYCSASYHNERRCLPAATELRGGNHIKCPLHLNHNPNKGEHNRVHMRACLFCKDGGKLLYCDLCPAAAHEQCSVMTRKNMFGEKAEKWFCESCFAARNPLFGDIVFCYTDHFTWWTAIVVNPKYTSKDALKEKVPVGMLYLRFLGTSTHTVQPQKHCLPFDIGYSFVLHLRNQKSHFKQSMVNDTYKTALEEAKRLNDVRKKCGYSVQGLDKLRGPGPYLWTEQPISYKGTKLPISPLCDGCNCTKTHPCTADGIAGSGDGPACMNALSNTECPEDCPAVGPQCQNQSIRKRVYPDVYVRRFKKKGLGLVANRRIKAGTYIGEYTGEVINEAERHRRVELNENEMFYYFEVENKVFIDANACGNHTRFMNHSCFANCMTLKWVVGGDDEQGHSRMKIIADRDIEKDEELTFSYNNNDAMKSCLCGSENCKSKQKESEPSRSPSPKPTKAKKRRKPAAVGGRATLPLGGEKALPKITISMCIICTQFKKQTEECNKCYRNVCRDCAKKHHQQQKPNTDRECSCNKCVFQCRGKRVDSCSFCMTTYCASHASNFTYSRGLHLRICDQHNPDTIEQEFSDKVTAGYNAYYKLKAPEKQVKATLKPYGYIEFVYPNGTAKTKQIKSLHFLSTSSKEDGSQPSPAPARKRKNVDESPEIKNDQPKPKRARKECRRTTPATPKLKASTSGITSNVKPTTSTPSGDDSVDFKISKRKSTAKAKETSSKKK